ncbi:hypothetical protein Tco_0215018, partial [Tanacetum coccineum]
PGAGSFAGVGGFVLFGGAIVTTTLMLAAFAFKYRRQKQSSSSSTKTPTVNSPRTKSIDFRMDNDEKVDIVDNSKEQDNTLNCVDSNLESEEANNSYEKIDLDSERRVDGDEKVDKESLGSSDVVTSMASVTDEKYNSTTDNDKKVETRDNNEDQDSANANFVDSVLESKDVDKSYGYIVLDTEPKDDGVAKVDTESLVSDAKA